MISNSLAHSGWASSPAAEQPHSAESFSRVLQPLWPLPKDQPNFVREVHLFVPNDALLFDRDIAGADLLRDRLGAISIAYEPNDFNVLRAIQEELLDRDFAATADGLLHRLNTIPFKSEPDSAGFPVESDADLIAAAIGQNPVQEINL